MDGQGTRIDHTPGDHGPREGSVGPGNVDASCDLLAPLCRPVHIGGYPVHCHPLGVPRIGNDGERGTLQQAGGEDGVNKGVHPKHLAIAGGSEEEVGGLGVLLVAHEEHRVLIWCVEGNLLYGVPN